MGKYNEQGVGIVFVGGVVQFKTELIMYTASMVFNYNFIRNNDKYVHVICKKVRLHNIKVHKSKDPTCY